MAKLTFTQDNLPSSTEFQELLEQAEARSSTIDDLLSLLRQLISFEQKYKLASDVFYARFMRGEIGDDMDFIKWAGRYELYLEIKQVQPAETPDLGDVLREIDQLIYPDRG